MKLSISNIAWDKENDDAVYKLMKKYGYTGLEIAPTRVIEKNPYNKIEEAMAWSKALHDQYGFVISSMQSIWYGRQEHIFGTDKERETLLGYTKMAIDFAFAINCHNLVFGCPKNRCINDEGDKLKGISFFKEIGDYAFSKGTVIGMEANPPIYNTNYINRTEEAIDLIRKVDSEGFKLNLDIGTMIYNQESIDILKGNVKLINHVHISEPYLKSIEKRELHAKLADVLYKEGYDGFISIEMGKTEFKDCIKRTLEYVKGYADGREVCATKTKLE